MTRPRYIISIDPDTTKSGVAHIDVHNRQLVTTSSLTFPETIDFVQQHYTTDTTIVIENSWTSYTNWHLNNNDTKRTASAKGYAIGRCHETGRKLIEMLQHLDIPVQSQEPLRKIWNSHNRKITHNELKAFIPNLPKQTNQDQRDAILLGWVYANLPVKVKLR